MADSIANILMQITGTSKGADDTLAAFLGKLKAFGEEEAEATADVNTGAGASKLTALGAALAKFDKTRAIATAEVNVKTASLSKAFAEVQAFADVADHRIEVPIDIQREGMDRALAGLETIIHDRKLTIDPKVNKAEALKDLEEITGAIRAASTQRLFLNIDRSNLTRVLGDLAALETAETAAGGDIRIDVPTAKIRLAEARLIQLREEKKALTESGDKGIDFDVKTASVDLAIARLEGELLAFTAKRRTVKIDADIDRSNLSLFQQALLKIGSVFGGVADGAAKMGASIGGATVNIGAFGVKLTPIVAIVIALAAAIVGSLVAALSLLVTALAGAAAAVGVLATAFIAALGPAVAVAVAAVSRITKIVQALKAKQTADKASAAGTAEAAAAEERRHNAIFAVGQALRAVEGAERSRADAIQGAKDAIVQAHREEEAAQRGSADAANNLRDQTVAAYRAMRQAAEDVRDAILGVQDAQLGIDKSHVAVKRAELDLKKVRGEAGLLGKELNDTFTKFTDVDFKGTAGNLAAALKGSGAGSLGPEEQQLAIEEAVLKVREAKLGEKHATDDLGDSVQALNDKRKVAADFQRQGIAAFGPYTAAIQQQRDATLRLADATERANKLDAVGVANSSAVLAANDALTNAQLRLKEARHDAATAAEGAAGGTAARKAQADWDALSKTEQGFALALDAVSASLKDTFGPAVNGVLNGIASGFAQLPSALAPLKGSLGQLGTVIGNAFSGFGSFLNQPAVSAGLDQLIKGSAQLATILGGSAFQAFFQIILNIANAAMPLLVGQTNSLAGWLQKLADKTSDTDKLGKSFRSLFGFLSGLGKLIVQIGRIFINFFTATSGDSKGFVKTLTDMAKGLADFIGSAKGQEEIKNFFHDVIPLAVQAIKFIGNVIVFFLQVLEIIAPALTGVLAAINFLLGAVNAVLSVLKPFLQVAAQIAILFAGGLPKAIGLFLGKFKLLEGVGRFLTSSITGVVSGIVAKLGFIAGLLPGIFDKISHLILTVIKFIGDEFGKVTHFILTPFREALKLLEDLGKEFFDAGKKLFGLLIDGIKSAIKGVGGVVKKGLDLVGKLLPGSEPKDKSSPLYGLRHSGRAIMENLASGIPLGTQELSTALHRSLVPVVAGIDTNVNIPRTRAPVGATAASGPVSAGHTENHYHIEAPAGQLPDAEATVQAIARRNERRGGGTPRA